jgi:hypothetical protein
MHGRKPSHLGNEYLVRANYESKVTMDGIQRLKDHEIFSAAEPEKPERESKCKYGLFASRPDNSLW